MLRRPPITSLTDTLFPDPTLFLSCRSAFRPTLLKQQSRPEGRPTDPASSLLPSAPPCARSCPDRPRPEARLHRRSHAHTDARTWRSEEQTSELQTLMRNSTDVFSSNI